MGNINGWLLVGISFGSIPMVWSIICYSGIRQDQNWTESFKPQDCSEEFTWCIISKNQNLTASSPITLYGCATHEDCHRAIKEFTSYQNDGPNTPRQRNNKGMSFFTSHGTKAASDTCCRTDLCNSTVSTKASLCIQLFFLIVISAFSIVFNKV